MSHGLPRGAGFVRFDRFHATNPGFDADQPHHEFLCDWGYLVKDGGELLPTHGAVALFGSLRGVRNLLPRPILDTQFLGYGSGDDLPEMRWIDRLVSEVNIIETWQQLLAKYQFFMPRSFRDIDPTTLDRRDAPAGFREAAMTQTVRSPACWTKYSESHGARSAQCTS